MHCQGVDSGLGRCSGQPSFIGLYLSSIQGLDGSQANPRPRREALHAWRRHAGSETRQLGDGSHSSLAIGGETGRCLAPDQRAGELPALQRSARSRQNGAILGATGGSRALPVEDPTLEDAVLAGNTRQAYQLFQELRRLEPDGLPKPELCDRLLQLVAKQAMFRICWEVYRALKPAPLRYSSLASVMDAAIRAEELRHALEVFRDMQQRGLQHNIKTWCHLISSLSKSRRKGRLYHDAAYSLWQELRASESQAGCRDASSYAAGMLACTCVGRVDEAEDLLEEMRREGFSPDIRAYNIVLRGHAKAGAASRLPQLLAEVESAGLTPSSTTYNTLIDAYVNAGMLKQAQQTMRDAAERGVALDAWAYSTLMKGHVRAQNLTEAMVLLGEMDKKGIAPNVVTMTTLLDGWVRLGLMDQAEAVLRSMEQRGVQPNVITFNSLLRGYAAASNMQATKNVLERMGEAGLPLREDTYNTLMEGALSSDNPAAVPRLFSQLSELDLRPDSLSYTSLLTALGRLSRPDTAMEVFSKLESEEGVCATALNALIAVLARSGRMAEAEQQLSRAVEMAAAEGRPPPVEAYGAVLGGYARLSDADAAMDLFREFQERGGEPDNRLIDVAATACIRAGQFTRALQLARAMERRGKNVDKARIQRTLDVVIRSRERAIKLRAGAAAALQPRNENLERLKFWLGLPNRYYGDSEQSDSDSESSER